MPLNSLKIIAGSLLALILLVAGIRPLRIIDERQQYVVTRFSEIMEASQKPGLKLHIPVLHEIIRYPKQILTLDQEPENITTGDKKYLLVDFYAKWIIEDPVKFKNSLNNILNAELRLNRVIVASLKEEIGKIRLHDILSETRNVIFDRITKISDDAARLNFGIHIIDVRIKQADLPEENSLAVFRRMTAERQEQAKKYRSEGEEEALVIRATTDKEKEIILAEAYKNAQIIRGEADATVTEIFAKAYNLDPDFFAFTRSLEAYRKIMDTSSTVVLSPESELFKYLSKY